MGMRLANALPQPKSSFRPRFRKRLQNEDFTAPLESAAWETHRSARPDGVRSAQSGGRTRAQRPRRTSDLTKSIPLAASYETRRRHRNKNGGQIWEVERSRFSARGRTAL